MGAPTTAAQLRDDVALLFRRAGFGAGRADLDAAARVGYEGTVDALLAQFDQPDPAGDAVPVPAFTPLNIPGPNDDQATRRAVDRQRRTEQMALARWWVARMVASSTPVREKLVLFWHGHFATSADKVTLPQLMWQQNQLFRTAGAGNFDALALAVAKDPAMLLWLDAASNKKAHPNENFARELMELFTLGIGNYTEADVREAARCFTGWRFDRGGNRFSIDQKQHDTGTKTVLGDTGAFGGEEVVHIVARHPAAAAFIASRVWSHYARPAPPSDPVVRELAAGFAADLNVRNLLRAVFLHPEFRTDATRSALVKTPIEYVVGTLRALGLKGDDDKLRGALNALGQEPFRPPSVGGWPQNGYWLNTASSLTRLQFAQSVAQKADLRAVAAAHPADRADTVARMLTVGSWSAPTAAALSGAAGEPKLLVALALVSPEWVLA